MTAQISCNPTPFIWAAAAVVVPPADVPLSGSDAAATITGSDAADELTGSD